MIASFSRHSRFWIAALCVGLFALGFFREQGQEHERLEALIQTSQMAQKQFQELVEAYSQRLKAAQVLVALAQKQKMEVPARLAETIETMQRNLQPLDARAELTLHRDQAQLAELARDLIVQIDGELNSGNSEFSRLVKSYDQNEQTVQQIKQTYDLETRRLRALTRPGDRKVLPESLRLPASVEMEL